MTIGAHERYKTWLFDCDGVILDSNRTKTEAFREVARPYGDAAAEALVAFHVENGGISRFAKFEHFLRVILGRADKATEMPHLLDAFADQVTRGLATCAVDGGFLPLLRTLPPGTRKMVVSGGAQAELRALFRERGLDQALDGIYGSPDTKHAIVEHGIASGTIAFPAVFVGDSRLDYEVASTFGMDFIFVSHWTEFADWRTYFSSKPVRIVHDLSDLITLSLSAGAH